MKTIKNIKTDLISRVSESVAFQKCEIDKTHKYVPKSKLKADNNKKRSKSSPYYSVVDDLEIKR